LISVDQILSRLWGQSISNCFAGLSQQVWTYW